MGFKIQEGLKRLNILDTLRKEKHSRTETELNFWIMMVCIDIVGVSVSKEGDYRILILRVQRDSGGRGRHPGFDDNHLHL